MPDFIQDLEQTFWTSMTRSGCVGNIKNCFKNKNDAYQDPSDFWSTFDRTGAGACVALQTLPYGSQDSFDQEDVERIEWGPVFASCKSLNYFACETEGRLEKIINQEKPWVKSQKYFLQIKEINEK